MSKYFIFSLFTLWSLNCSHNRCHKTTICHQLQGQPIKTVGSMNNMRTIWKHCKHSVENMRTIWKLCEHCRTPVKMYWDLTRCPYSSTGSLTPVIVQWRVVALMSLNILLVSRDMVQFLEPAVFVQWRVSLNILPASWDRAQFLEPTCNQKPYCLAPGKISHVS